MANTKTAANVRTRRSCRALIVEISGVVGEACPPPKLLISTIAQSNSRLAIFDLSKADRIDSHGLEWLEQVAASLVPSGVKVRIVAPEKSKIARMLSLMKFDRFVLVLSSLFDAVTFGRRRGKSRNSAQLSKSNLP
jgi:anti-anti-sigma regulatory factor